MLLTKHYKVGMHMCNKLGQPASEQAKANNCLKSQNDANEINSQFSFQHASAGHNDAKATVIQYNLSTSSEHLYGVLLLYLTTLLQDKSSPNHTFNQQKVNRLEQWIEQLIEDERAYKKRIVEFLNKNPSENE